MGGGALGDPMIFRENGGGDTRHQWSIKGVGGGALEH